MKDKFWLTLRASMASAECFSTSEASTADTLTSMRAGLSMVFRRELVGKSAKMEPSTQESSDSDWRMVKV